jgi:hypothetical protein
MPCARIARCAGQEKRTCPGQRKKSASGCLPEITFLVYFPAESIRLLPVLLYLQGINSRTHLI